MAATPRRGDRMTIVLAATSAAAFCECLAARQPTGRRRLVGSRHNAIPIQSRLCGAEPAAPELIPEVRFRVDLPCHRPTASFGRVGMAETLSGFCLGGGGRSSRDKTERDQQAGFSRHQAGSRTPSI